MVLQQKNKNYNNNNIGQMGGGVDNHTVEAKKGAPEKSVSDLRP